MKMTSASFSRVCVLRLAEIAIMALKREVQHKVTRENWFENHPKFNEIQSYGYFNGKPSMARAAMTVYLDLCESKHWFSVSIHPCESLKLVYITGKRIKKSPFDIVVPVTIDTALTTEEIQNIVQEVNLCEEKEVEEDTGNERVPKVTMAFCEADSTVVYYDFFQGLVPPDPPAEEEEEVKPKRKRTRQKREASQK